MISAAKNHSKREERKFNLIAISYLSPKKCECSEKDPSRGLSRFKRLVDNGYST
jgi:hypothetical protein